MRRRSPWRGSAAVAVVVGLVLLLLAGAGYWFFQNKSVSGATAFDLADHLPGNSQAVWMVNLQGQIDVDQLKGDFADVLAKVPADERAKFKADLEKDLGIPWTDLLGFFDGRAAVAVIPKTGEAGAVALAGLRDGAGFASYMTTKMPVGTKSEKVGPIEFWLTPKGQYFGYDATWVYFADSKVNAELVIASASGKETLSANPLFVQAKAKVAEKGSLFAFYWDIGATTKLLEPMSLPYTDPQTYKELACLQYAVGSLDLRGKQWDAFLKVDANDSMLSQKLLAKGSVSIASFGAFSESAKLGQAIDLEWAFNTVVALAGLSPESRSQAGIAAAGLMLYGNPWGAFEGDVAVTGTWLESLYPTVRDNFINARARGQLTACKSNLKNIGTGLEMWSTDNQGHYPKSVAALTPNYLKTIPVCPAAGSDTYSSSYKMSSNPDSFEIACSGNHHELGQDNFPAYSSTDGLVQGPDIADDSAPPETPSVALSAIVKDPSLVHGLLAKMLPNPGAEPKPGEEKIYPVPGGTLRLTKDTPPRLLLGMGDKSEALLDIKGGTLADKDKLKQALSWGGDGVIYADTMDLTSLVEELKASVPDDEKSENQVAREVLKKLDGVDWVGASCVTVRPDGLQMRAYGTSNGGLLSVAGVGAAILVPNFIRARSQGQLTACKSNLKNIGTGLEMWSTDHSGEYPDKLSQLIPNYLRTIPNCPVSETDTYSASYKKMKSQGGDYLIYQVECQGQNHESVGVPANYPKYNEDRGLIEQP